MMSRKATRAVGTVPVTIFVGLASAYLFWSAALCKTVYVDRLVPPPAIFSVDLDIPFSAVPRRPNVGLARLANAIHPRRMLLSLNERYYGAKVDFTGTPAGIPWVCVTVRSALTLATLAMAVLATRLGWLGWRFSLRALFGFVAVAAIACWAHGQLNDGQRLQPNRDLAWAVSLTLVGMAAGIGAAKVGNRTHGPKQESESEEAATGESVDLDDLVAGITPENRRAEVDFGPPVGREAW